MTSHSSTGRPQGPASGTADRPAADTALPWAILETVPAMIWLGDPQGRCVLLNRALRDHWGVADADSFEWSDTLHPDDAPRIAGPYSQAMEHRQPFRIEARYRRADGEWRILQTDACPHFDSSGQFLGMVGVNTDITEQRRTERDLRLSKENLEFAIEAAGEVGTWIWDVHNDVLTGDSRTWCGIGDGDGRHSTGRFADFLALVHEEDRARVCAAITRTLEEGRDFRLEYRLWQGGHLRWVFALGRCERDALDRPVIFAGVTVDVTDRRTREDAARMLAHELSHRLKNVFGVMQVLTAQTARCHPDATPALDQLARRIQALGVAQMLSFPATDAPRGESGLRHLAERVLAPYAVRGDRLDWDGPDLPLSPERATALALILHELATNSAKYGSLSTNGKVRITLSTTPEGVRIEWSETGGPPVTTPQTSGFGSRLIRQSAASLGAQDRWLWLPEGLLWTVVLPAAGHDGGAETVD